MIIEKIIKKSEIEIKNKIENELKKIEYNFSYKGTEYLVEAIYILYNIKKENLAEHEYNFELEIYPIIAEKYNTSVNTVKRNIRNATDKMYYDCDEKILKDYLRDFEFSKPGAKRIAFGVLAKL